jgi:hypothetical protein
MSHVLSHAYPRWHDRLALDYGRHGCLLSLVCRSNLRPYRCSVARNRGSEVRGACCHHFVLSGEISRMITKWEYLFLGLPIGFEIYEVMSDQIF